ncbi:hypothetical protein C8A03DRAFT_43229 [Achaetomium macrosporum]|uniref:Uncharacterized protein n=1 Tax=Achaetomium macrosporum TaxID=79813 RepID=A0AAN7CBQ2_9PEZI|nr:hypothetical protein C8A03DRAFT_43229 [Achaetomium macrosporum]
MPELCGLLVRMSLADETPAALAARHAISALSYQHLGNHAAAVMHQAKSLGALQVTINRLGAGDLEAGQALQAMAASMLLNIFETLNFDGSSLSWAIFFCGCKKIVNLHDTLYKFSTRHWYPKQTQQILLAAQKKVVSKAVFSPLRQIILASTGCSLQLLDLLCQIVDAVLDRDDPNYLSPEHLRTIRSLELRLDDLTQTPRIASTSTGENHERQLAELYRLAAKIYLLRMARGLPRGDPVVVALVDKAMHLLKEDEVQPYGRPWPLFVPLGNLPLVRRLIHAAWVRMDLAGDNGVDLMDVYNAVVSGLRVPPSFT